jgi:hypothetical protein
VDARHVRGRDRRSARAAVGEVIRAFTGIGGVGVLDTMVITRWEPPAVCEVRHLGRVVRGTGRFAVEPLGDDPPRSRIVWEEHLDLPLGAVGRLGWPLVRPLMVAGVRRSLRTLATAVATAPGPGGAASSEPS